MLPIKTISRLVKRAKETATTVDGIEGWVRGIVKTRKKDRHTDERVEVWAVKYDAAGKSVDYLLYHYGTLILAAASDDGGNTWTLTEQIDEISVSDQQGMNAFAKVLGVQGYYARREGRTADYGGLR